MLAGLRREDGSDVGSDRRAARTTSAEEWQSLSLLMEGGPEGAVKKVNGCEGRGGEGRRAR